MTTCWAPLLVGAAIVVVMTGSAAAEPVDPPPPGVGIRLVEAPTDRADDPRARSYIIDRVGAGSTFTRRIEVSNGDPQPMDVLLYGTTATLRDGDFSVGPADATGGVAEWISVTPRSARLQPGQRLEAVVSVTVAEDAPDDEYYGAVVVERPAVRGVAGVSNGLRAAVRVYLSVGQGSEPASDFLVDSMAAERGADGRPVVTALVRNTGGRALDLSGSLSLSEGPGGLSGGPFLAQLGTTLAPGDTGPVTVPLDQAVRGGPWTATLTLRSGLLERQARAQITFPDDAGAQAAPVAAENLSPAEDPRILIPIAVSLILLTALLLLSWLLARRRARPEHREEQELVPAG